MAIAAADVAASRFVFASASHASEASFGGVAVGREGLLTSVKGVSGDGSTTVVMVSAAAETNVAAESAL